MTVEKKKFWTKLGLVASGIFGVLLILGFTGDKVAKPILDQRYATKTSVTKLKDKMVEADKRYALIEQHLKFIAETIKELKEQRNENID